MYAGVFIVQPREFPCNQGMSVGYPHPYLFEASGEDCPVHLVLTEDARDEVLGFRFTDGCDCSKSWGAKLL